MSDKLPQLLFLAAFLATFGIARFITHAIRAGRFGLHDVERGGTHIHHLVWGILLLLVGGYLAVALDLFPSRNVLAVVVGVGAGLALDEFALWVNLEDVYWSPQGRRSVEAVIATAVIATVVLLGVNLWVAILTVAGTFGDAVASAGLVGVALSAVCLLRRRFAFALVGVFVPPVALAGAVLPARWIRRLPAR